MHRLKEMFYRVRSSRLARSCDYSVSATPQTPTSDIPPDQGDQT